MRKKMKINWQFILPNRKKDTLYLQKVMEWYFLERIVTFDGILRNDDLSMVFFEIVIFRCHGTNFSN